MNGLTAGKSYNLQMELYIPSSGGVDPTQLVIAFAYSTDSSTWNVVKLPIQSTLDAWQKIKTQLTLPSNTTGVWVYAFVFSQIGKVFYIDEMYLYESVSVTSGLTMNSCYVHDNTSEGIMLECSGAHIETCRVENNTNYGIDVVEGQSNMISSCYCANNGSDVGIDNSHANNFYDGGLGTIYE